MKEDIKNKWVKALESGEYRQGTGYLHKKDNFCCLGVLCDLAAKEGVVVPEPGTDGVITYVSAEISLDSSYEVLPEAVQIWSGLQTENPILKIEGRSNNSLAEFNDEGKSFKEIAELIKEYIYEG